MRVKIDILNNFGNAIVTAEGKKLFLPGVLPDEEVDIKIISKKNKISHGQIVNIINKSDNRQIPPCKHFFECGGCNLQHMKLDYYYQFKISQTQKLLKNIGYDKPVHLIKIGEKVRHRTRLKLKKIGKKVIIGFVKNKSHDIFSLDECLLLEPSILDIIKILQEELIILNDSFFTKVHELFIFKADNGIELSFIAKSEFTVEEIFFLTALGKKYNLLRIINQIANDHIPIYVNNDPTIEVSGCKVIIPPGAFLQVSKKSITEIIKILHKHTKKSKIIIDLYCGLGIYSLALSQNKKILAVDIDERMINSLKHTARRSNIKIDAIERDLLQTPIFANELEIFDTAVINPPRSGGVTQFYELAESNVKTIIIVSCNPATLKRDIIILQKKGYEIIDAYLIDQFYYSYHIEMVVVLSKKNK